MAEDRNNVVAFDDDPFGDPPEKKKFLYPRLLRIYRRIAHEQHWCDTCCSHIQPGEEYEGRVEVFRRGCIVVWRSHVNPMCEPPPDPDELWDDVEEDLDIEEAA